MKIKYNEFIELIRYYEKVKKKLFLRKHFSILQKELL